MNGRLSRKGRVFALAGLIVVMIATVLTIVLIRANHVSSPGAVQRAWEDPVLLAMAAVLVLSLVALLTLLLRTDGDASERSSSPQPGQSYAAHVRTLARLRLEARRHTPPAQQPPAHP